MVCLPPHLRQGLEKRHIIRLENNNILVKAVSLSVMQPFYYAPAAETKHFSDFARILRYSLATSSEQKHPVSRFRLPMTAVWRTRRPHTPHQEHLPISWAELSTQEL